MLIASLHFNHLLVLNNQNIYAAREHKYKKKVAVLEQKTI